MDVISFKSYQRCFEQLCIRLIECVDELSEISEEAQRLDLRLSPELIDTATQADSQMLSPENEADEQGADDAIITSLLDIIETLLTELRGKR